MPSIPSNSIIKGSQIKKIFFICQMLEAPLLTMYPLLAIFLVKECAASPMQVSLLTMLKPAITVLSFYWGILLTKNTRYLKPSLLLAVFLSALPFLLAPWVHHSWFFVLSGALYALFSKAKVPALMELLKINSTPEEREKIFAKASSWGYVVGGICSFVLGYALDINPRLWTLSFCVFSLFLLSSVFLLSTIPDPVIVAENTAPPSKKLSEHILHPWKEMFSLLQNRIDFFQFQVGFFIAGFGLMLIMPAIPSLLTTINASYTNIFISIGILKGLGFIFSSNTWAEYLQKKDLSHMTAFVFSGFVLFMVFLLFSYFYPEAILIAYFLYGLAQAGSHLIWHLSGPIFAGSEKSAPYSSINILAIGIRGLIAPPLGAILTAYTSPPITIALGISISLLATWYMLSCKRLQQYASPCTLDTCI